MKKTNNYLWVGFLCLFLFQNTLAQSDSLKKVDSLNAQILQEYNNRLILIEQQRKTDSIKKIDLETQLLSLKTTDNLKKEDLQKQLEELSNQETRRIAAKKSQINSLRESAKSFPVNGFFGDTLFYIYSNLGSFSARDRAEAISNRIENFADDYNFTPDSLKISKAETTFDLLYGKKIILSVSENDAIWNNLSQFELTNKYKEIIEAEVLKYKAETSFKTLAKSIGLALLVLLIFSLMIYYLGKLFKWTQRKIESQENKLIKGVKIKNYSLLDAKRQINAILTINSVFKWVLIFLAIYIALPILFGIFPWTRNFAEILFGYVLNPLKKIAEGLWGYLPDLITILVIVIVFRYATKGLKFFKDEIERGNLTIPGFFPDWANPTYQIVRVIIWAFMLVVIFPYLPGSDSPVFQGVSVFLGFLFTFGSAGSLSNVIAGLVLTYMRLFKIGDRVKIGEVVGDVIEKSLLVTRIRTIKNEIISIPNSAVMNSHTINYSSDTVDKGLIMHTSVTIGYDVPWKKIHQALLDAADRTEFLLKEPKPFVLQTSLEDFYVAYQLNAYTKEANKQANIYSQLHANIQDCCNEVGIEILSPHYRAARDGNMSTIPTDYLSNDYKAPGFKVNVYKS